MSAVSVADVAMSDFIIRPVDRIRVNDCQSIMLVVPVDDVGECIRRHSYTTRDGNAYRAAVWD